MGNLFKWGKTTLGLVPGLTLIFYNMGVPTEIPRLLVGGIVEAIGAFTLIIFYLKGTDLRKWPTSKLTRSGILFCSLFILALMAYITMYDCQNIYSNKYDTSILIPFWKNGNLNYMITKAGSVNSAILRYGPEAIDKAINDAPLALSSTKLLFIINYLLLFEFLVIGFGFLSVKAKSKAR